MPAIWATTESSSSRSQARWLSPNRWSSPRATIRADFANDTFTFTIEIDKAEGQEFPAEVRDVNNEPVGDAFTIAFDNSGQATHSLKDGETLYIRGLSAGWEYLVSEQPTTGFDQIAPAENNNRKLRRERSLLVRRRRLNSPTPIVRAARSITTMPLPSRRC